jgi:hypothetical protein
MRMVLARTIGRLGAVLCLVPLSEGMQPPAPASPPATCLPSTTERIGLFIGTIKGMLVDSDAQAMRNRRGLIAIQASDIVITTDSMVCRRVRALDLAVTQANNGGRPPDSVFSRTFIVARAGPYWAYRMHRLIHDPGSWSVSIANDSLTRVLVTYR